MKTYGKHVQSEPTTEILKRYSCLTSNQTIEGIIVYFGSTTSREENKEASYSLLCKNYQSKKIKFSRVNIDSSSSNQY